ncbi:MAG: hypothetical protein M3Y42_04640 [Actinomycetota bacterium]|nr:hypothetical protein [Actinomycetota bacterium]MDQ2956234.1 hypothetical protein [Actinomycetota bacterium]
MTASPELRHHDAELHDRSYVDMLERLFRQFEDRLPLTVIVNVVTESREHLRGSPVGALPELTERLAIERLNTLGAAGLIPASDPA